MKRPTKAPSVNGRRGDSVINAIRFISFQQTVFVIKSEVYFHTKFSVDGTN